MGKYNISLGIRAAIVKSPSLAAHFKKEETNRPTAAAAAASERVRVREAVKAAGPARKAARSEKIGGTPAEHSRELSEGFSRNLRRLSLSRFAGQNRESFKMAEKRARR